MLHALIDGLFIVNDDNYRFCTMTSVSQTDTQELGLEAIGVGWGVL